MMSSTHASNFGQSFSGKPASLLNTIVGIGRAYRADTSATSCSVTCRRSSREVRRIPSSSRATALGENSGSRIRRYRAWSGGSTSIGISGKSVPRSGSSIDGATPNVAGSCSAAKMSWFLVRYQNPSCFSLCPTGHLPRSREYVEKMSSRASPWKSNPVSTARSSVMGPASDVLEITCELPVRHRRAGLVHFPPPGGREVVDEGVAEERPRGRAGRQCRRGRLEAGGQRDGVVSLLVGVPGDRGRRGKALADAREGGGGGARGRQG